MPKHLPHHEALQAIQTKRSQAKQASKLIGRSNHVYTKAKALEALCEEIDVIVFVKNLNHEFLIVSDSFTEYFTASNDLELLDKERWDEDYQKQWEANEDLVISTKKAKIFEEKVPTYIGKPVGKDNPVSTFFVKKIPIINDEDEVIGVVGIATPKWST